MSPQMPTLANRMRVHKRGQSAASRTKAPLRSVDTVTSLVYADSSGNVDSLAMSAMKMKR